MKLLLRTATALAVTGLLAACGGGSGNVTSTPAPVRTPTPSPPPTPTPTSPPTSALMAPALTPANVAVPVYATGATPSFQQPGPGASTIQIPLVTTAVTSNFSGVSSNGTISGTGSSLQLPGGIGISAEIGPDYPLYLEYTRFGTWGVSNASTGSFDMLGVFAGGFQTPLANIPVTGTASYSGGTYLFWGGYPFGDVIDTASGYGAVAMVADFGSGTVTGSMTSFLLADGIGFNGALNDLSFNATIGSPSGGFSGSITAGTNPGGYFGVPAGSTGNITGLFYGPAAQEAGGAWTLTGGTTRVIGSFGVKQ